MTVLVSGGAGFIGRNLIEALTKEYGEKTCYSIDNYRVPPVEHPVCDNIDCDVRSPKQLLPVLEAIKPEVIVWFAARQGYRNDYVEFGNVNVKGAYNLFQCIDRIKGYEPERILLASSQAIYSPGENVNEGWLKEPPSLYGFSKLQQEQAFRWFCKERDIILVAMRYSIVAGPGISLQSYESGMIRNWYKKWRNMKGAEIYGNGTHRRDFVHIDDVTEANLKALEHTESDVFNIGGFPITVNDAFMIWRDLTGCYESTILGRDVRPGGEYSMTSSSQKALKLLKWQPVHKFDKCIKDFLKKAEALREHSKKEVHILKLPSYH